MAQALSPEALRRPTWSASDAGKEHEGRRAQVRHPPRQELGGRLASLVVDEGAVREEASGVELARAVVEGHQQHDEAAHPVQRHEAPAGRRGRGGSDRLRGSEGGRHAFSRYAASMRSRKVLVHALLVALVTLAACGNPRALAPAPGGTAAVPAKDAAESLTARTPSSSTRTTT